jgi:hypothetical protein
MPSTSYKETYLASIPARFSNPVVHLYLGVHWESSDDEKKEETISEFLDSLLLTLEGRRDLEVLSIDLDNNPRLAALFWAHFAMHQDRWVNVIENNPHIKYVGICHINEKESPTSALEGETEKTPIPTVNPYWPLAKNPVFNNMRGYETKYGKEHQGLSKGRQNHTWLLFNFEGGMVGDDAHHCKSLSNAKQFLGRITQVLIERGELRPDNAERLQAVMFRNALQKYLRTPISLEHDVWEQILSSLLSRFVDTGEVRESGFTMRGDKYYPYLDQDIHAYVEFELASSYVWKKLFELCERQNRSTPRAIYCNEYYDSRPVVDAIIETKKANKYCPIKAVTTGCRWDGFDKREFNKIKKLIQAGADIRYTLRGVHLTDWYKKDLKKTEEMQANAREHLQKINELLIENGSTLDLVIDFSTMDKVDVPQDIKALCLAISKTVARNKRFKRHAIRGLIADEHLNLSQPLVLIQEEIADSIAQIESPHLNRKSKSIGDIHYHLRIEQQVAVEANLTLTAESTNMHVQSMNQEFAAWQTRNAEQTLAHDLSGFLGKDKTVCNRGNCVAILKSDSSALFSKYGKKTEKRHIRYLKQLSDEAILSLWDSVTGHIEGKEIVSEISFLTKNAWAYFLMHHTQCLSGMDKTHLPDGMYKQTRDGKMVLCYDGKAKVLSQGADESVIRPVFYTPKAPSSVPFDMLTDKIENWLISLPKSKVPMDFYEGAMSAVYVLKDLLCQYGYLLKDLSENDLSALKHLYIEYGLDGILQVVEALEYRYIHLRATGSKESDYPSEFHQLRFAKSRFRKVYDYRPGWTRNPDYIPSASEIMMRDRSLASFPVETKNLSDKLFNRLCKKINRNDLPPFSESLKRTSPHFFSLFKDASYYQWSSLENIYLKEGAVGLNAFLSQLYDLSMTHQATYLLIKDVLLSHSENAYQFIKSKAYDRSLECLQSLKSTEFVWFKTLLDAHGRTSGSLDLPAMLEAYKQFLDGLEKIDKTLELPDVCEVVDADNFYMSLNRIDAILSLARSPKEQLGLLSGVSLKAETAFYALKEDDFRLVTKDMQLSTAMSLPTAQLSYKETVSSLITKAQDDAIDMTAFKISFYREAARGHYRYTYETYQNIEKMIRSSALDIPKQKKLMALVSLCSSSKRNYHEYDKKSITDLIPLLEQPNQEVFFELLNTELVCQPNLNDLINIARLLTYFSEDEQADVLQRLIQKINCHGVYAYESIAGISQPSFSERAQAIDEIGLNQRIDSLVSSGFEFGDEEESLLRALVARIRLDVELKETEEMGLYATLNTLCDDYDLVEVLKAIRVLLNEKLISPEGVSALLDTIHSLNPPLSILNDLGALPTRTVISSDAIYSLVERAKVIMSNKDMPWKEKRQHLLVTVELLGKGLPIEAIQRLIALMKANLMLIDESEDNFLDVLGALESEDVSCLISERSQVFFETIGEEATSRFLMQNPKALLKIIAKGKNQILFASLLSTYPLIAVDELVLIMEKIEAASEDVQLKLGELAKSHSLPSMKVLQGLNQATTLAQLEWDKYGTRTDERVDAQLSDKEVLRAISLMTSLVPGATFQQETRAKIFKRIKRVNQFSKLFVYEEHAFLEARLNALLAEEESDDKILELIALMREMAYRFGPKKDGEGLFANSTQILAVIDVLFHEGNLGLQIPTGEGKSLVSALIASSRTQLTKKPVDILTSNQTLSFRDYTGYASFYQKVGLPVSYITPHSSKEAYIHGEEQAGINISGVGDMNLFQSRLLFEGKIQAITNHLLLDECDDFMLDKRTHYNHPISLHGDETSEQTVNVWEWVYPALNAFIETDPFINSDATRSQDVLNAKQYLARYPGGVLNKARRDALNDEASKMDAQISTWLDSACFAKKLIEDKDFMIIDEVRETEAGREKPIRYARILSDGRPDYEAQWGRGVHQCLHARLNEQACERGKPNNFIIEAEQDIALSANAKNFIDRYQTDRKCALSATPGSAFEIIELKKKYGFDFHGLPHHNPLKREELPCLFADNDEMFYQHVLREIKMAKALNKPILFVCKDTHEVNLLMERIKHCPVIASLVCDVQSITGRSPKEEVSRIKHAGKPGVVTIATPMVGRGTDIKLEVPENGFRVRQTFSSRKRIDIQIMGRVARQGQKGEYGQLLNLSKEPLLREKLGSRYTRHTDLAMNAIWEEADIVETQKRLLDESVSDIKNVLNHLFCEYVNQGHEISRKLKSSWTKLLIAFDDKWALLSDDDSFVSMQDKLKALVDEIDRAWIEFVSRNSLELPDNTGFYEAYLAFVIEADRRWYALDETLYQDKVIRLSKGEAERKVDFEREFGNWNQCIRDHISAEYELLDTKFTAAANVYTKPAIQEDLRQHYIRAQYDPNLAGHARIYTTLFADERALLTGKKNFFSDFLAYLRHIGTLFAETKAVLRGERPFFANTRMTLKYRRIQKDIHEIDALLSAIASISKTAGLFLDSDTTTLKEMDNDLIRLSQLKMQLTKLGKSFANDKDIDKAHTRIAHIKAQYQTQVISDDDISALDESDTVSALKRKSLVYINTHATISHVKHKTGAMRDVRQADLKAIKVKIEGDNPESSVNTYLETIQTGRRGQSELKDIFIPVIPHNVCP